MCSYKKDELERLSAFVPYSKKDVDQSPNSVRPSSYPSELHPPNMFHENHVIRANIKLKQYKEDNILKRDFQINE